MPNSPNDEDAHSDTGDVASILSSRMTDIASNDGEEHAAEPTGTSAGRLSRITAESVSRPNTAATSSQRRFNSGNNAQRVSGISNVSGHRPQSSVSRTHVPSLQSHAFFRPMSSQRLQAQRGSSRPAAFSHQGFSEDGSVEGGGSVARNSVRSDQTWKYARGIAEDGDMRPPPSRGTEMTEQERVTANTSPTQGHYTAGSLSESVRPLQRNNPNTKGLSVNIDKSYKNGASIPTSAKSPHSFRSSFLMPTKADAAPNSPNRSTHGREKLSSVASSPGLTPTGTPKHIEHPKKEKLGGNYEYFTGNTIFCWGGRFQNTQDKPINIGTGLLVLVPGILFYIFSAPWLWYNISPAIPIVFAYIWYICMSSFIHASLSDPGVSATIFPIPHVCFANHNRFFLETFIQCLLLMRMMTLSDWRHQRMIGL